MLSLWADVVSRLQYFAHTIPCYLDVGILVGQQVISILVHTGTLRVGNINPCVISLMVCVRAMRIQASARESTVQTEPNRKFITVLDLLLEPLKLSRLTFYNFLHCIEPHLDLCAKPTWAGCIGCPRAIYGCLPGRICRRDLGRCIAETDIPCMCKDRQAAERSSRHLLVLFKMA